MIRKIQMAMTVAGLVGTYLGLVASYGAWWFPVSPTPTASVGERHVSRQSMEPRAATATKPRLARMMANATLSISGTGANVTIRKGPADVRYAGGEVSSVGAESIVYLPLGQRLKLEVSGTGAKVLVEEELMPYIQMISTSVGSRVTTFVAN